jgi:hypothetical protein
MNQSVTNRSNRLQHFFLHNFLCGNYGGLLRNGQPN